MHYVGFSIIWFHDFHREKWCSVSSTRSQLSRLAPFRSAKVHWRYRSLSRSSKKGISTAVFLSFFFQALETAENYISWCQVGRMMLFGFPDGFPRRGDLRPQNGKLESVREWAGLIHDCWYWISDYRWRIDSLTVIALFMNLSLRSASLSTGHWASLVLCSCW